MARKRAAVMGTAKKTKNFALMAFTLGMVIIAAYFFNGKDRIGAASSDGIIARPVVTGENVAVPLTDLEIGVARFYDYAASNGLKMSYFVVKTGEGEIHSALNACESCWPAGKGYTQDGNVMVCNNCRMRFPLERIGLVRGGCNPSPLTNRVSNGSVLLKVTELEEGKKLFDLKK